MVSTENNQNNGGAGGLSRGYQDGKLPSSPSSNVHQRKIELKIG